MDSHEQHLNHLRQLLNVLREAKFQANPGKCVFGEPQVFYLGYMVSKNGIKPPPAKIEAIQSFPRPEQATELRRFLGMTNYYHRCLPHAAAFQAPLHEMLKGLLKKVTLLWTTEADQAFEHCKASLTDVARTAFLRPDAPLALKTDASSTAIGASLEQQETDGSWRPLGFFSHKLTDMQRRYSAYDREHLAALRCAQTLRTAIRGTSIRDTHGSPPACIRAGPALGQGIA